MKHRILATWLMSTVFPLAVFSQQTSEAALYLEKLPPVRHTDEKLPQTYVLVTDYMEYNATGTFLKKMRVSGQCSFLKKGYVNWKNVQIAESSQLKAPYPVGKKQQTMENLAYRSSTIPRLDSLGSNEPQARMYLQNLIWDLAMFKAFAGYNWDSLQLNTEFSARDINSIVTIPEMGVFENKDIRLTWTGISKVNGSMCAVIKYIAMNNPLEINYQTSTFKGRSHYWGSIFVSLSDKQIEYADMYEDVLLLMYINGQQTPMPLNTVRYITLKKS